MPRFSPSAPALFVLAALAASGSAHEDDPKVLDRQPPYPGLGIRTSLPMPGSGVAALGATTPFASEGVTLLSWLTLLELGPTLAGNDCWGYTSPAGREYAMIGLEDGLTWVEVSDPRNPVIIAKRNGPNSVWRDIKVYGTKAYVVTEGGGGLRVYEMDAIDQGVVTYLGNINDVGVGATHNVAIDTTSGYLYRCGGGSGTNNGLRIYDLGADPAAPPFVGQWNAKYVHDAQVVTLPGGQQIAYCCSGFNGGSTQTGLTILDVTDKSNPTVLREVFWPNAAYSHQVWLSEDLRFAYLNDELDEGNFSFPTTTYVIDVENPSQASLVGSFTNGNAAVGHNLYLADDLLYEANYRSGLRVFETSDPTNPTERYWFDTYPPDDAAAFNGLWSVYPFFPSGIVIGSDIERGLFVWWVGPQPIQPSLVDGPPDVISPGGEEVLVVIEEQGATYAPGTAQLHYDAGMGLVSVPLVDLGRGQLAAPFPAIVCGTRIDWFLSAETTTGGLWYEPANAPGEFYSTLSALGEVTLVDDPMEEPGGWTVGAPDDDATSGIWEHGNPIGTAAQPADDHTPSGMNCWFTGQGSIGGSVGENDVDNGVTTLVSPTYDLSAAVAPRFGYWRWFSNGFNGQIDDVFTVEIDDGSGWRTVEIVGPTGPGTTGGWNYHEFAAFDLIDPSPTVRLRFRAADEGAGSIVEAAVDDLTLRDAECSGAPLAYCTAKVSGGICLPTIGYSGTPSISGATPFEITGDLVEPFMNGLLFYGYAGAALPFMGGTLCVQPPLRRLGLQNAGGSLQAPCSGSYAIDFGSLVTSGADSMLTIGTSVHAQWWLRDPDDITGFGVGLSNGLRFDIQP